MIRPYTSKDKQELLALLKLNIPKYFAAAEESDFREYLEQHVEDYYVYETDGQILASGGINYFPDAGQARISWDIVHPDFQGRGIGKKLTQHRIDRIKSNPTINLIMVRTTQLVYPFYEKMGFVLEKIEKDFWAEGFDLYQMIMPLEKE